MSDDMTPINQRIAEAITELRRRNLQPTAVYLGDHEYALARSHESARYLFDLSAEPERIGGLPMYRVRESRHFAVVYSPADAMRGGAE